MSRGGLHNKANPWAIGLVLLLGLSCWTLAQDEQDGATYSSDPADKEACQTNLNLIFEAIQQYRNQHGDSLPEKLSDLVPSFILDRNILICPFAQKTGGLAWLRKIRELKSDPRTPYGYEFPSTILTEDLWRGLPQKTFREWKERQLAKVEEKVGRVVPIVRCFRHGNWMNGPHLNLASGGQLYESGLDWERNYAQFFSPEDLHPAKLFASGGELPKLTAKDFAPQAPGTDRRFIDLSHHYNARLTDAWQGFPSDNLENLPRGLQDFGSGTFDIRGLIQLRGAGLPIEFPEQIDGIPVNQRFSRVHFLQGTAFSPGETTEIGCYLIHYTDGQSRRIPLIYRRNIVDWWLDPKRPFTPPQAKIAWTGMNDAAKAYGRELHLYQLEWKNPLPDLEVSTISFFSRRTKSAPFLVAITLER